MTPFIFDFYIGEVSENDPGIQLSAGYRLDDG